MHHRRQPRRIRRLWAIALTVAVAAPFALTSTVSPAAATDTGLHGIGPGSPLLIDRPLDTGGTFGCTANFIWQSGSTKYLGTAGHCVTQEADGSAATRVRVCATNCVFGSFTNTLHEFTSSEGLVELCGPNTSSCSFPVRAHGAVGTDFALIPLPSSVATQLRPEVPIFGGPNGTDTVGTGDALCIYGGGLGVGETIATKGRPVVGLSSTSSAWYGYGPTAVGDSGAPVIDCTSAAAVGIHTHGPCLSPPSTSCGTTIARAKALASAQGLSISIVEP